MANPDCGSHNFTTIKATLIHRYCIAGMIFILQLGFYVVVSRNPEDVVS